MGVIGIPTPSPVLPGAGPVTTGGDCVDKDATYANIIFFQHFPIVLETGIFPIADLPYQMNLVRQHFGVIYVVTSGINGETVFRGTSYEDWISAGGTPPPQPPVGGITDSGGLSCDSALGSNPPCPTGFLWDTGSMSCIPAGTFPPPFPPDNPPPGSGGGGGGGGGPGGGILPLPIPIPTPPQNGDSVSSCCGTLAIYIFWVAKAIEQLTNSIPSNDDGDCCTNIVSQLALIYTQLGNQLQAVQVAIGHLDYDSYNTGLNLAQALVNIELAIVAQVPPDFTPIVTALDSIVQALQPSTYAPPSFTISTPIADALIQNWVSNWGLDSATAQVLLAPIAPPTP